MFRAGDCTAESADARCRGNTATAAPTTRCRYPSEYALANHVQHPRNLYLREHDIMPHLDQWLLRAFSPHRLTDTVDRLHAAQQETPQVAPDADLEAVIAECESKLAQYRAVADAGGDPATIASWTADVMAQRAAAVARRTITHQPNASNRLSKAEL